MDLPFIKKLEEPKSESILLDTVYIQTKYGHDSRSQSRFHFKRLSLECLSVEKYVIA